MSEFVEITGTLSNCKKWYCYDRAEDFCIVGEIHNDTKNRFPDGRIVHTSKVKKIEGEYAFTLYSVYRIESWKEED